MSELKKIGILVALVAGVWIYGKIGNVNSEPSPAPAPFHSPTASHGPSDAFRLMMAETDVKKRLRDPSSADFGPMRVRVGVVCGSVNSRNGYGGMTGQQRFISRMGVMTVFADDVKENGFTETWNSVC